MFLYVANFRQGDSGEKSPNQLSQVNLAILFGYGTTYPNYIFFNEKFGQINIVNYLAVEH